MIEIIYLSALSAYYQSSYPNTRFNSYAYSEQYPIRYLDPYRSRASDSDDLDNDSEQYPQQDLQPYYPEPFYPSHSARIIPKLGQSTNHYTKHFAYHNPFHLFNHRQTGSEISAPDSSNFLPILFL